MCFDVRFFGRAHKARRDITCYKLLEPYKKGLVGLWYNNYVYQLETENSIIELQVEKDPDRRDRMINEGYHSYRSCRRAMRVRCFLTSCCNVYKCIIPKGSIFYKNRTEYVSSNIIIKEEL